MRFRPLVVVCCAVLALAPVRGESRSPWDRTRLLGSGSWILGKQGGKDGEGATPKPRSKPRPVIRSRGPEEHLARARSLEEEGRHRDAVREYEKALRLEAGNLDAMVGLCGLLIDQEFDVERGLREIRGALTRHPGAAALHDLLGWGYYKKGETAKARKGFEQALKLDDVNVSATYHLGVLRMKEGRLGEALDLFRKVIALDPSHAKGHLSMGLCYRRLGERRRACEAFDAAYGALRGRNAALAKEIRRMVGQVDPTYVLTERAAPGRRIHPALEDPGAKATSMGGTAGEGTAEALPTTRPSPPRGTALPLARPRRGSGATSRAVRPDPPPSPRPDLRAPEARPDPTDSTRLTRSMLRRDLVRSHLRLGKLYRDYRLYEDARGEFQTVVNLDPAATEARTARGLLLQIEDEPAGTRAERIEGYRELGAFLFENHDHANARVQYQKILLLDEGDWAARKSLAFLLAREGRFEEAEAELKKALDLRPDFPEALLVMGYVRARQRRFRDAASCFADALAMSPPQSRSRRYAEAMLEKMKRFTDLR